MSDFIIKEKRVKDKGGISFEQPLILRKPPARLDTKRQADRVFAVLRELRGRPKARMRKIYISVWKAIEHRLERPIEDESKYMLNTDDIDEHLKVLEPIRDFPEDKLEDNIQVERLPGGVFDGRGGVF
jgi:hypothetical protein